MDIEKLILTNIFLFLLVCWIDRRYLKDKIEHKMEGEGLISTLLRLWVSITLFSPIILLLKLIWDTL